MRTKTLWIKDAYLAQILSGQKTIEVRAAYSNVARLQAGDRLLLNDEHAYLIKRVGRYEGFEALLAHEPPERIAPGVPRDELLGRLRALYPAEKESLAVIALEIEAEKHE